MSFLRCLFLGHWCCLAAPLCGRCQEDQSKIQSELTPERRNPMGEVMGKNCASDHSLYAHSFGLLSALTRAYAPVHGLGFYAWAFLCFVSIELVKECSCDWVQIAYKSGPLTVHRHVTPTVQPPPPLILAHLASSPARASARRHRDLALAKCACHDTSSSCLF